MTIGLVSIVENPYIAVLLIALAHSRINVFLLLQQLWAVPIQKRRSSYRCGYGRSLCMDGQLIFNLFIGAFVHIIGFARSLLPWLSLTLLAPLRCGRLQS